ncbi:hypothetical protein E4U51_008279 [Claviceps purpurea]|nr:hypothetical protein E4U51_008279 [Claviceps purpurea]
MDDDFSDEDLCDEGDTADFIDKDTASIPDEGLNTEENLPEESLSECVLVFEENQGSENSCHEVPAAEDPTADNTKVSCDEDPDQHDEDPPCKEVESADFPTKHDNQQGKKEEILPEEFVSSANELQCDFPMQGKILVTIGSSFFRKTLPPLHAANRGQPSYRRHRDGRKRSSKEVSLLLQHHRDHGFTVTSAHDLWCVSKKPQPPPAGSSLSENGFPLFTLPTRSAFISTPP